MIFSGKVWKFGDNIDTDVIIPARYLVTTDAGELAKHCMETIDPSFATRVQPGDILVGGRNFGCGSSREHAPVAIKGLGISCVIAKTFARIFFRNAVNIGLPILECPEAVEGVQPGEVMTVDTATGLVTDTATGKGFQAEPFPEFMQEIIAAGGLMNYVARQVGLPGARKPAESVEPAGRHEQD